MSKFVIKTPFEEWATNDMDTSQKWQLMQDDWQLAIEEIKQDMEERASVKKQARQNERQKKH